MADNFLDTLFKTVLAFGGAGFQQERNRQEEFFTRIDDKVAFQNELAMHKAEEEEAQRKLDEERKYNSPAEQSKRLLEAGINPFYAITGADTSPTLTSVANPDLPEKNSDYSSNTLFNMKDLIDTFINFSAMDRENMLAEKQNELLDFQKLRYLDTLEDSQNKKEMDKIRKAILEGQLESLQQDQKDSEDFWNNLGKNPWLKHGFSFAKLLLQLSKLKRR